MQLARKQYPYLFCAQVSSDTLFPVWHPCSKGFLSRNSQSRFHLKSEPHTKLMIMQLHGHQHCPFIKCLDSLDECITYPMQFLMHRSWNKRAAVQDNILCLPLRSPLWFRPWEDDVREDTSLSIWILTSGTGLTLEVFLDLSLWWWWLLLPLLRLLSSMTSALVF